MIHAALRTRWLGSTFATTRESVSACSGDVTVIDSVQERTEFVASVPQLVCFVIYHDTNLRRWSKA